MTGRFVARASGTHVFHIAAAGRLRARVGSELAIDAWFEALPGGATSSIELDAGEAIDLLVEYASMEGERWRFLTIGCREPGPEVSVEAAAAAAADADLVVVVAGLSDQWESEGFDRPNLALPGRQDDLITAVAARQPRTVVVLTAGAPVEMPWLSDVSAVIQAWYGGQEVGHAVADVLFGHADPGGRLPVTFPMDSRQHPGLLNYPGVNGKVRYGEGVYVGYRGYDRLGLQPLFPFGYGLSYSTFRGEVGSVGRTGDDLVVEVEVMNIGERLGTEVVQLYVRDVGGIERKLAGFSKVELEGHAAETVRIVVPISRLRWWDPASEDWRPCTGTVALDVAGSFGVLGAEAAITPS
jgi:beta-glucosidase